MFIALSGGVKEIPTSVDDRSALFHSNFQISHLSLFLLKCFIEQTLHFPSYASHLSLLEHLLKNTPTLFK